MNVILTYRGRPVTDAEAAFIRPRDMVCRGLLLALHRAGQICLPAPRVVSQYSANRRLKPAVVEIDSRPIAGTLGSLGPLRFGEVRRTAQEPLFHSLIEEHHYLGYTPPVGEHLKYLVFARQRVLACFAWSSVPRHLGPRDRFIGWSPEQRRRHLPLTATNLRFLVLPWVRVPHLASHLLGRTTGRGKNDRTFRPNRSLKEVLGYPLHRHFRELLSRS